MHCIVEIFQQFLLAERIAEIETNKTFKIFDQAFDELCPGKERSKIDQKLIRLACNP